MRDMGFELTIFVFWVAFVVALWFFGVDKDEKEIRIEWLDEETRCFYQGERIINCETVRGYE